MQLLGRLRRAPGDERRVSVLAAWLDVTVSTASEALSTLARKGHVKRVDVAGDRRGAAYRLTATGRDLARVLDAPHPAVIAALAAAEPDARAATLHVVRAVLAALHAAGVTALPPDA